jgi:regulator of cell morphogenesis and NO signaling
MIILLDKNETIGAIVAKVPEASKILSKYGIDFCCGGHRKLIDVIKEKELEEDKIFSELMKAGQDREQAYGGIDYSNMLPSTLTDYIEGTHHSYLRENLPEIAEMLNTVLRVHGKNHKELFELYRIYGNLKTELEQHLLKEEAMLFPLFDEDKLDDNETSRLSAQIILEHEAAGKLLAELRRVTNDYCAPEDACTTFVKTYERLEELEKDLHQHIHLENNILLKEYDFRSKE